MNTSVLVQEGRAIEAEGSVFTMGRWIIDCREGSHNC